MAFWPSFPIRVALEACLLVYAVYFYASCKKASPGLPLTGVENLEDLKHALDTQGLKAQTAQADAMRNLVKQITALESKAKSASASSSSSTRVTLEQPKPVTPCPALPPQQHQQSIGSTSSSQNLAFYTLAVAGTSCHAREGYEYWGDVVEWGSSHHTATAAECCAACKAHRDTGARGGLEKGKDAPVCNVWVHCGDPVACGERYKECWLKRQQDLPALPAHPQGGQSKGWVAGALYPDLASELTPYVAQHTFTMVTRLGPLKIKLLPGLAPVSVKELQRMATTLPGGVCSDCRFYRAETNFLVQGVIAAPGFYVAVPRNPNPQQPKVMERGLVCWAGGAGGPDFFVNLVDNGGFGDSHLCWGKIEDMTIPDQIVKLPTKPKKNPNEMTFIQDFVTFNLTLS